MSLVAIVNDEAMSVGRPSPLKPTGEHRTSTVILIPPPRLVLPMFRLSLILSLIRSKWRHLAGVFWLRVIPRRQCCRGWRTLLARFKTHIPCGRPVEFLRRSAAQLNREILETCKDCSTLQRALSDLRLIPPRRGNAPCHKGRFTQGIRHMIPRCRLFLHR